MKLEVKEFGLFDKEFEPLSEERLKEFEERIGIKIPQVYRDFLISLGYDNNPYWTSSYLKLSFCIMEIDYAFSFENIEMYYLEKNDPKDFDAKDYIPKEFVPIASIEGGQNWIFISASEEYGYGCIYCGTESNLLREHGFFKDEFIYNTDYFELYKEFDSFDEFINSFATSDEYDAQDS